MTHEDGGARRSLSHAAARRRTPTQIAIAVTVLAALCVLRRPELLAAPRFWAEEGNLFFHALLTDGLGPTLLQPPLGYQNLATTLATALASLVPLESAPTVTTWIAFGVQLLTASLAITMVSRHVTSMPAAMALAAATLLLAPNEIWFTSTNLHYWLGVASWLVLCDERCDGARPRHGTRALLLVAGLSGVQSCFLVPWYAARAWTLQSRERWVQSSILALAAVLQAATMISSWLLADRNFSTRWGEVEFSGVLLASYHFTSPLLGHEVVLARPTAMTMWSTLAACATPILTLAVVHYRERKNLAMWTAWIGVILLSTAGSLHFAGGFRYAFGPNVILLTILLATCHSAGWQRVLSSALLGVSFTTNTMHYRDRISWSPNLPQWPVEVQRWRDDGTYVPHIWPSDWTVTLPPR